MISDLCRDGQKRLKGLDQGLQRQIGGSNNLFASIKLDTRALNSAFTEVSRVADSLLHELKQMVSEKDEQQKQLVALSRFTQQRNAITAENESLKAQIQLREREISVAQKVYDEMKTNYDGLIESLQDQATKDRNKIQVSSLRTRAPKAMALTRRYRS
jgi:hypothetical protein